MLKRFFTSSIMLFVAMSFSGMAFAQTADEILDRFKDEPTVAQTQDMAIEFAGFGSKRLESMYKRAGAAKALPKSLTYSFRFKDEDRKRQQVDATDKTTAAGAKENTEKVIDWTQPTDTLQHDIKAQWDLSGLIYNPDQLRVVSEMSRSAKQRDAILSTVTKVYFARRKAQIKLMTDAPDNVTERLNLQLSIQEYTANLDALTGGAFSQALRDAGIK